MSSRSLVKHFKRIGGEAQARKSIFRVIKDDARVGIITAHALIDVGLERLLLSRMRRLSGEKYSVLFEGTAPLASFATKARVCHALGIVGPKTYHDLETINDIRNAFAHAPRAISLKSPKIWNRVKGLHIYAAAARNPDLNSRDKKFIRIVAIYALLFAGMRHKRRRLRPRIGDIGK